ncbi:hypothetical protein HanIR_Chr17g0900451 [Helianthus annuus]|nr:hypothetical protein HanIR_Chr17g0900451 [Helianthus annuus]
MLAHNNIFLYLASLICVGLELVSFGNIFLMERIKSFGTHIPLIFQPQKHRTI